MADSANQGTARSLVEDLRRILAEDSDARALGEAVNVGSPKPMGSKAPPLSPAKATLSKLGSKHARSDAAADTLSKLRKKYGTEAVEDPTAVKKQSASVLSKLGAKRATSDASMDALSKLRKKYGTEAVDLAAARKSSASTLDKLDAKKGKVSLGKSPASSALDKLGRKYGMEAVESDEHVEDAEEIEESDEAVVEADGQDLENKVREKRKKSGGGGHNPFKRKDHLGKGPRGHYHNKTNNWKCACTTPYKCLCRNRKTGGSKTITIKRGYKKDYNKEYKSWRKGGLKRAPKT